MDIKKAADEPGDRFVRLIRGMSLRFFSKCRLFPNFHAI